MVAVLIPGVAYADDDDAVVDSHRAPMRCAAVTDTSGSYCEFVNGVAQSNADFFYAPNVIGSLG